MTEQSTEQEAGRERPSYGEVVDALADMVNQHAYHLPDGLLIDGGLSANECAFDVLERLGVLRQPNPRRPQYAMDWDAVSALSTPTPDKESHDG